MDRRSRSASAKIVKQCPQLNFIDGISVVYGSARLFKPSAGVGVRQDRQRFLKRFELVGTDQDGRRATVARDDDAVVRRGDAIDDL